MIRVILKHAIMGWFFLFIMAFCLLSAPAYSADKAVAKLTSFSGTVLIKSRGDWGVKPEMGLILYSDDKIITKMGIATITFDDGAVIEVKANSNLLIRDTEQSGVAKQLGAVKRELRLLIGKILFRSGKGSSVSTSLETTTMVCGLRGTAGTLSIDAAGQSYLQFTEGGGDTIGNFIAGIAADVPVEVASLNPAQRASFVAAAAADQARRIAEKVAGGEATNADAALASANAAEAAAREALAAAEEMLDSPDETIRNEARAAITAAQDAIDAAKDAEQRAISAGATGALLGKDTANFITTAGFDVQSGNFLKGKDDDAVLGNSYGVLGDALTRQVFSPTTQGNENQILPSSDVTPPVVDVTYAPSGFVSTTSPVFDFSANEYSTYYYQLDGGSLVLIGSAPQSEVLTLTLSGLSEGNHTLDLFAQNAAGNRSQIQTFSWIQDTIAPVPVLTAMPNGSGATNLSPTVSNTELGTVTYNYINIADGSPFLTADLPTGTYGVAVIATDQAGNVSQPKQFLFSLVNSPLTSNVAGSGSLITGTSTGASSVVISDTVQSGLFGGWSTSMTGNWSGTHSGGLSLNYGGLTEYGSYWLSLTSGTINPTTGAATGGTDFIIMDAYGITKGTGTFTGTFNNDANQTWNGTETGSNLIATPLRYSGSITSSGFYNYTNEVADSITFGYAGAAQNGNLLDGIILGEYSKNETGTGPYLLVGTVLGTDPVEGQKPSALVPTIWKNGNINGFLTATYDDLNATGDAGIFYEDLTGNYYEGIGSYTGMWLTKAQITPIEMVTGVGVNGDTRTIHYPTLSEIHPIIFETQVGGNISFDSNAIVGASATIPAIVKNNDGSVDMLFGVWGAGLIGSYSAASDGWTLSLSDKGTASHIPMLMEFGTGSSNSTWTSSTQEISAFAVGAWVDLDEAVTGVAGGKLIGTFDPANQVWQAAAAGSIVDTKTFLAMAATDAGRAKLAQLDIPCIEVGSTTLSGSGGNLTNVTMDNVKFFAYSTGAAPKIWATGDVNGTTNGSDPAMSGYNIAILNSTSGASVSASFTMKAYNNSQGGNWDATVSGSGTVSVSGSNISISIEGNSAGKVTTVGSPGTAGPGVNGVFSGTASGVTGPPN